MKARIFTLENELDRLKVQALEKEQLSKQVKWVSYFVFVHSKKIFILIIDRGRRSFKKVLQEKYTLNL